MRVAELKALTRERGLRGYSRLRKAELVVLLQNNPPPPLQAIATQVQSVRFRPDRTQRVRVRVQSVRFRPDRTQRVRVRVQSVRFRPDRTQRLRQSSPQEMDIFEQLEMSKSRPQVMSKLNDWYNCQ